MDKLELNFVPLHNQDQSISIYRKLVVESSQKKGDGDYRVNLPEKSGNEDWKLFDVSLDSKKDYEEFVCKFSLNNILTVHILYQLLIERLNVSNTKIEHYFPKKAVVRKEVGFIFRKFDEGNSDIFVSPYFLKEEGVFGFLLEHKFTLNDNQPFNRKTQILSFSLDKSGKPNIYFYKDKRSELIEFLQAKLCPFLANSNLDFKDHFSHLDSNKLEIKTYLTGKNSTARSQFMGIKSNGPFRPVNDNVRYLFLFSERTRSLARDIYLGLIGKLYPGQFSGLERMFSLSLNKDIVDHCLVDAFDKSSLGDIKEKIEKLKRTFPQEKVMILAVLPKGFKGVDAAYDAYGHLKLLALEQGAYCQVVTEDTFYKKDQLKWSISNIGLQVFSKLGGAPWLVKPAKSNCLIFGLGTVQEFSKGRVKKYTAYTVCLDSSGDFKYIKPLSSSSDEDSYLNNFKASLKEVLSSELGKQYQSFVLHLPYKINNKEITAVKEVVSSIREDNDFEVIIIRINTRHKYLGFSDHNTCVPYESTYIKLSNNEFLIWAEGLQFGKEVLHKRVSEPLYVQFLEAKEDWQTRKECLQDILNLTGANWRGFNSKAQPISILYSRLIAKFMKDFSHLEDVKDMSIVSAESIAPWF
jgi:hypothetical protein